MKEEGVRGRGQFRSLQTRYKSWSLIKSDQSNICHQIHWFYIHLVKTLTNLVNNHSAIPYRASRYDQAESRGPCRWSPSPLMLSFPWERPMLFYGLKTTQPLLVVSYISQTLEPVGAQDDASPLRAPAFKHLNQLIQIDAALCLVELCPSAFEFICRVKLVRTLNHYSSQSCRQLSPVVNYR